jgi:L-rhamnose mutarotase
VNRYLFVGRVRAHLIPEYTRRHAQVWPEMLDALRAAGFHNYSIHLRQEDGLLVGYFESPNAEQAMAAMARMEVNARWQAEMAPFFVIPEGKRPDECFEFLGEVFYLP